MTIAMSSLNIMSFFHLVDDFAYLNTVSLSRQSAVKSISEQINQFKRQSSVCVCVCVCVCECVCACACVCVCVCKLRKLLVCLLCKFCIFNNCSLSFKI